MRLSSPKQTLEVMGMAVQRIHKTKSKSKKTRGSGSVAAIITPKGSKDVIAKCTESVSDIDAVLNQNRRY
jgi:hypothetical protein